MSSIFSAFAAYDTLWLSYDRDNFYTAARETAGSFYYYDSQTGKGTTYQYEIASAIQYWSFNHKDTPYSSVGTIRVAGGAKIVNPAGYRALGVLTVKVELILYPTWKDWWWWWTITTQDGEIDVRQNYMSAVNLRINRQGDSPLYDVAKVVLSQVMNLLSVPFDIFAIEYLATSEIDSEAGPDGGSPTAHVIGRAGWPDMQGRVYNNAELAYDFLYTYYKDTAVGYKGYELGVKISVDFGWVNEMTREGIPRNVYVTTRDFEQRWIVNVYW